MSRVDGDRTRSVAAVSLAAVLAAAPAGWALDPDRPIGTYEQAVWRRKDGLPLDSVRAIARTRDGQLWVGTLGGLARFDGQTFARLDARNAPAMKRNEVLVVRELADGRLLAGGYQGLLEVRADGIVRSGEGSGLPDAAVFDIHEDRARQLWIATAAGLFRQGREGGRFARMPNAGAALDRTLSVVTDRRGRLFVGTEGGLHAYDAGTHRFVEHPASAARGSPTVTVLLEDRGGRLWAGTADGLLRVDDQRGELLDERHGLFDGGVLALAEDGDGALWIGGRGGLARVRGAAIERYTRADGLPADEVPALLFDDEGILWVGTHFGGLLRFTDRTVRTDVGPRLPPGATANTVAQDPDGALWVGTERHGLVRLHQGRATWIRDGLPSEAVRAVLPDGDGQIWIGTNRGLVRWREGRIDTPVRFPHEVKALLRDRAGRLWIGTDGQGLGRLSPGGRLDLLTARGDAGNRVGAIAEDREGEIWVGTLGGLFRVRGDELLRDPLHPETESLTARALLAQPDGTLWVATNGQGLLRRRGGKIFRFDHRVGLPDDYLYQLLADGAGNLWIGTRGGLLRVELAALEAVAAGRTRSLEVMLLDSSDRGDSIEAARALQPAAWKAADGRLWFAAHPAPLAVDPGRVRRNVTPPKVVISQVVVDDRRLAPAAVGRLGPGPRTLEFHYAGLSLVQPHRVAHRHRLEGFDPDWVEAGARRVAHYNNLGPGRYRFRVTASNNDGVWNATGASVSFEIAPHPFQTAWFYALCGAAAVALALGLHTLRLRQIRARYQAVLTERRRVARELHDSVLQAVASIGWQLTAVKKRVPASAGDAHRQLDVAQDLVARSLDETRWYIVGLRTAEAGEDDLALALTQMARRVTLGSPLRCEVLVGGQPRALASAVERELYRIAQEALTNAARHAGARRVDMRLHYGDASLRLSISDDGRGFEAADGPAAGHFGIVGMRERAEQIGGRFSLRSAPGAGTTIEVTVPAAVSTTEKAHG